MGFHIYLCLILVSLKRTNGDSFEESQQFVYNHAFAPPSVVFNDIYPPGRKALAEDPSTSFTDSNSQLNSVPTQFVEFHPRVLKIQPITPPPRILLKSSIKKAKQDILTTTSEPDDILPMKEGTIRQYQRGVLDLLLPASRVRTFKTVFDTVRRMLSYTFRRR